MTSWKNLLINKHWDNLTIFIWQRRTKHHDSTLTLQTFGKKQQFDFDKTLMGQMSSTTLFSVVSISTL